MRQLIFLITTALLFVFTLIAMWDDTHKDWTRYQGQFLKTLAKDERRGVTRGIDQVLIPNLDVVDRCMTCHLAITKPNLALAEEPFTAHPGTLLKSHPPEKFGCVVCHGGQGLATEVASAHGDVAHWEKPLLRGPLVQASCAQCHGNVRELAEHVPLLLKGQALFEAKGCFGCHAIRDFGQTISQDLTEVGSKPYLLIDADFEIMEHPHDRIHWLMAKLWHPRRLNPGVRAPELPAGEEEVFPTAMPHFGLSEGEAQALTIYLLSLTDSDYPVSYTIPAPPEPVRTAASPVKRGQLVFEKFGCAGCHGIGGVGGRQNWNAGLGQEVPSLLYVKAYYGNDVTGLKELIRYGRQPVPRADVTRPNPPLYMPDWGNRISDEELDALVAYLFSLSDRLPAAPKPQPTGAAQAGLPHPPTPELPIARPPRPAWYESLGGRRLREAGRGGGSLSTVGEVFVRAHPSDH